MARDINYGSEQHDGESEHIVIWWCIKCNDYHYGPYECPYEDYDFCPHCGQIIKRANEGG